MVSSALIRVKKRLRMYREMLLYILWFMSLNLVVFLVFVLRYLPYVNRTHTLLQNLYLLTIVPGYGFMVLGVLSVCVLPFVLVCPSYKLITPLMVATFAVFLGFMLIDSFVYDLYRFHLNYVILRLILVDLSSFNLSLQTWGLLCGAMALILLTEVGIVALVRRVLMNSARYRRIPVYVAPCLVGAWLVGQSMFIWAHEYNVTPITGVSPHLPFFFPITSHKIMVKFGLTNTESESLPLPTDAENMRYPLQSLNCAENPDPPNVLFLVLESWRCDAMSAVITPTIHQLGADSLMFTNHLSNGSVTTTGLFSLFYGLSPTYWNSVIANNGMGGPLLLQEMRKRNYQFRVISVSEITRIKIRNTVFHEIPNVTPEIIAAYDWEADRQLTDQFLEFLRQADPARPFFGALMYYSTHHRYDYPDGYPELFTPALPIEASRLNNATDPSPYFNRYRNAANYDDALIAEIIAELKRSGRFDNTIIVITGDHAEEFNDNQQNYWGHGSNFTQYQVKVPLVIHWPGQPPRLIDTRTSHVDLSATLLQEVFQCQNPIRDFSSGKSLFAPGTEEDVIIVGSYFNYAFIQANNVYAFYPVFMQDYQLDNITQSAQTFSTAIMRAGVDQMHQFYKK